MPVSKTDQVRMYIRWRPQYKPSAVVDNKWKFVSEVTNYPELYESDEILQFRSASNRNPTVAKGSRNVINANVEFGYDRGDAGQALLRRARHEDVDFQFKIELRDFEVYTDVGLVKQKRWTVLGFRAFVAGGGVAPGSVGTFVMSRVPLVIPPHTLLETVRQKLASAGDPTISEAEAETETEILLEEPYTSDLPPAED